MIVNIDDIINYDLSIITYYYSDKENINQDESKLIEIEMKKYLYLIAKNHKEYGMTRSIDMYWHTFILFTKEYHDFCDFLGCSYIHHSPATREEEKVSFHENFINFIEDYESAYKMKFPNEIWLATPHINCGSTGNCKNTLPAINNLVCGGGRASH
ncbi:MAG: hypothetical protein EPN23_11080 [Verrucomicrobia bacterium]|nr:MAG: hypothetical protein EPN23_11080 [Verrucomicrobiota bacterium]